MKRARSILGTVLALLMAFVCVPAVHAGETRDASLDAAMNAGTSTYTYTASICRGGSAEAVTEGGFTYAVLSAADEEQGDNTTYVQTTIIAEAGDELSFRHASNIDYMNEGGEVSFGIFNSSGTYTELYCNEEEAGDGSYDGEHVSSWETFRYTFTAAGAYTARWSIEAYGPSSRFAIQYVLLTPDMTLERAVNEPGYSIGWNNDIQHPWEPAFYGGSVCIRSGAISHSQTTSLSTNAIVLFEGDMFSTIVSSSCEKNYDMLHVYVTEISASNPTEQHQGSFSGISSPVWSNSFGWSAPHDGVYTFRFEYTKDSSVSSGDDCVYIKSAQFDRPDPIHALAPGYESYFALGTSTADYTFVPAYYSDEFILESNNKGVPVNAEITINSYLTTGDGVALWYYVSCENVYDYFEIKVDGSTMLEETGSTGWKDFSYTADTTGLHEFKFIYHKDESVNGGEDCVRLMQMRFVQDQLDIALREEGSQLRFTRGSGAELLELIEGEDRYYARLTEEDSYANVSHVTYINGFEYITFDYRVTGDAKLTFIAWDGVENEFTDDYSDAWHTYYYRIPSSDEGYFAWEFETGASGTVCLDNIHFGAIPIPIEEAVNDPETEAYPTSYSYLNFGGRYDPKEPRGVTKYAYTCPVAGVTEEFSWTIDGHIGDNYQFAFKFFDEDGELNGSGLEIYRNGELIWELNDGWAGVDNLNKWAICRFTLLDDEDVTFRLVFHSAAQAGGDGLGISMLKQTVIGVTLDEALNVEGGDIHFISSGEGCYYPAFEEDTGRYYGAPDVFYSDESLDMYYSFETGEDLSGWTMRDEDGDGWAFRIDAIPANTGLDHAFGDRALLSGAGFSSSGFDIMNTDNWAISPLFTVPYGAGAASLSFQYAAAGGVYHPETFGVYILPNGDFDEAIPLGEITTDIGGWDNLSFAIEDYNGMDIRIAFRHYTPTGASGLIIDSVSILCGMPVYSEFTFDADINAGDYMDFDVKIELFNDAEITNPVMLTVFEDGSPIYYIDSATLYGWYGDDWGGLAVSTLTPGAHTYRFLFSVFNSEVLFNSGILVDEFEIVRAPQYEYVDQAEVLGYAAPAAGSCANDLDLSVPGGSGYKVSFWYYRDIETEEIIDSSEPLTAGRSYILRVALEPLEGFIFSDEVDVSVANCSDFTVVDINSYLIKINIPVTVGGMLGDTNCDGQVTMADVTALIAKVMNAGDLSALGLLNADANRDGSVNILDAAAIYAIAFNN